MKKLIINKHSFIDIITNSSMEIFICDNSKSVDFIKMMLRAKCEETGEMDWHDNELSVYELDDNEIEIYSFLNDPDWFCDFVYKNFNVIRRG